MNSDCTEREIQEITNQMGYHVTDRNHLRFLADEINKILDVDLSQIGKNEENIANQQLFTSLCIDPSEEPRHRSPKTPPRHNSNSENYESSDYISSPILSRKRSQNSQKYEFEDIDYPTSLEDFDDDKQEAEGLINHACETLKRVYNTCRNVDHVSKMMESVSSQQTSESDASILDEQIAETISIHESETNSQPPKVVIIDPSIRPRLATKPGRAPYKFDPVTRYHLYKEEWERHPAPGERRRLALRWKIREYMLRNDIPQLETGQTKVQHPKDWSPRPYLS